MRVPILPILIEDVWENAPTSIQGRLYKDFRLNYEAALELLVIFFHLRIK
jgi:hypothetical protein